MQVYRIVDWEKHFENNRTRELKILSWIPVPNKQDGDGYTELLDHKDGASHFGCWHAILQVASKCDPRGTLVRGCKIPHDFASLSRITRISAPVLKAAIERLLIIGWLEVYDNPALGCGETAEGCRLPEGKEGKEGKGIYTVKNGETPAGLPVLKTNYEKTKAPEIKDYGDILNPSNDPILVAISVTGETEKTGWGHWLKVLNHAKKSLGADRADRIFRGCLRELYGEMKQGECKKPGACLNLKLKKTMEG